MRDPSGFYYRLSTIAQSLEGAIALLSAFLLYQLQKIVEEARYNDGLIVDQIILVSKEEGKEAGHLARNELHRELLRVVNRTTPTLMAEQKSRLTELTDFTENFMWLFRLSLILIGILILVSVILIPLSKEFCGAWEMGLLMILCIAGFGACLASYVVIVRHSLAYVPSERRN